MDHLTASKPTGNVVPLNRGKPTVAEPAPRQASASEAQALLEAADDAFDSWMPCTWPDGMRAFLKNSNVPSTDDAAEAYQAWRRSKVEDERNALLRRIDVKLAASNAPAVAVSSIDSPTLSAFAKRWTSGDLHREYPDHVRDIGQDDNRERLALVSAAPLDGPYATVGDVPLDAFMEAHALAAMAALPKHLAPATRAHVAHALSRLLKLARFPAGLIKVHPLSPGFVPLRGPRKAGAWWRPDDDKALMARTDVPLVSRLFYGFTFREGLREDEAAPLTWRDLRVEKKGARILLDENKTDDPRSWALYPGTHEALTKWRAILGEAGLPVQDDAPIFVHHDGRNKGTGLYVKHLAETFRAHVVRAELWRPEFDKAPNRMRLRFHDVRAGFVSWALATGRSEAWVTDRTGHTSSAMLYRYKRRARAQEELEIGEPLSLVEVIPELQSQGGSGASSAGGEFRFRRRKA